MKKLKFQILLYGLLTVFSWMIVGLGAARQSGAKVSSLQPVILNEENNHFLEMDDVRAMVRNIQERPLEECKQGEIKIGEIERSLESNPYVKTAEAYTDVGGNVVVELQLRKPLARVMYEDGTGFYLDHEFNKVDLSSTYSANTPLLRGLEREPLEPRDTVLSTQLNDLREFLLYVDRSELLRAQVSEVVRRANGDLVLFPEMGDVVVEFGKPDAIEEKFANMELFYRRVLNYAGWKKYKSISLKYKNQVVARRN
jgi:cell division protein FtsQ